MASFYSVPHEFVTGSSTLHYHNLFKFAVILSNFITFVSPKNNGTGHLFNYIDRNFTYNKIDDPHREVSLLLDSLLSGYDNSLRPDFGGPPTQVEIDIEVRSMGPISEVDMMYSMVCYFRQSWTDRRLSFNLYNVSTLALSISMLKRIWKPDTYFRNGKKSQLHTMTIPNRFVRLNRNGSILYSSRLTIRATCEMSLQNFPMDTQICMLELGSYAYATNDVQYSWNKNRQIVMNTQMELSQFEVISHPHSNNTYESRRVLMASFHLKRFMGYFMIQVYAPCTLLVILSWVSFWINREATADRVALGVTTILTMTFLGLDNRNALPKVGYATALDLFLAISYAFVFATILQFALVHYFTKYGSGEEYFIVSDSDDDDDDDNDKVDRQPTDNNDDQPITMGIDGKRNDQERRQSDVFCTENHTLLTSPLNDKDHHLADDEDKSRDASANVDQDPDQSERTGPRIRSSIRRSISFCLRRSLRRKSDVRHERQLQRYLKHRQLLKANNSVSKIDQVSRLLFPVTYIAINVVYWLYYLQR